MTKERRRDLGGTPEGLTHNPFAKLLGGGARPPSREGAAPAVPGGGGAPSPHAHEGTAPAELTSAGGQRVVVQVERKGHGGKTVTRAVGLSGDLDAAARDLARALGAGARATEDGVVVQG
jgi:hypothetical protein